MRNKQHQHGGPRKGAGRPPSPDTQPLISKTQRMTFDEWREAQRLADAQSISVNEIIRRLIRAESQRGGRPRKGAAAQADERGER